MARKCEEDIVPETANFGECKSSNNNNSNSSNSSSNGASGNAGGATTVKGVSGPVSAGLLPPPPPKTTDRILVAVSPKQQIDDDADDILSMSLNKIDSPPPQRPVSRTKGSGGSSNSNSSSSNHSATGGGVEDLVRRKSNALSKVQSKSDSVNSPLDGASVVGSASASGNAGSGSAKASSGSSTAGAAGADMDGVDLCSTDEVKVFKDEGDRDDEKMSVEHNLLEEKSSLIDFTENEVSENRMSLLMCEIVGEEEKRTLAVVLSDDHKDVVSCFHSERIRDRRQQRVPGGDCVQCRHRGYSRKRTQSPLDGIPKEAD